MSKASEVPRLPTAFSLSPGRRKRSRVEAKEHLRFIRNLPSVVSGLRPCEAAHVRYAEFRLGKRAVGIGEKPDDRWTVPLTADEHREQHAFGDERGWWVSKGIDPLTVALALWGVSGDEEAAELVLARANGVG